MKSKKYKEKERKLNHYGYICHHCSVNPIHGKCHKCTTCKVIEIIKRKIELV